MTFYRVFIPKGETVRPLGVPTLSWRIYQRMFATPLMIFTQQWIPAEFHGYIPRRGTGTAWRSILLNVIPSRNIYEIDFKQFFPSIPPKDLMWTMAQEMYFPAHVCLFFYNMNVSTAILPKKSPIFEINWNPEQKKSMWEHKIKLEMKARPVPKHFGDPVVNLPKDFDNRKGVSPFLDFLLVDFVLSLQHLIIDLGLLSLLIIFPLYLALAVYVVLSRIMSPPKLVPYFLIETEFTAPPPSLGTTSLVEMLLEADDYIWSCVLGLPSSFYAAAVRLFEALGRLLSATWELINRADAAVQTLPLHGFIVLPLVGIIVSHVIFWSELVLLLPIILAIFVLVLFPLVTLVPLDWLFGGRESFNFKGRARPPFKTRRGKRQRFIRFLRSRERRGYREHYVRLVFRYAPNGDLGSVIGSTAGVLPNFRRVLPGEYLKPWTMVGLPQGAPLSPYLSILYLANCLENYATLEPGVKFLFYADDGIFYSDDLAALERYLAKVFPTAETYVPGSKDNFPSRGIFINRDKSG